MSKLESIFRRNPSFAKQIDAAKAETPRPKALDAKQGRQKYGNHKVERDGMKFDSKLEAAVYARLCDEYGKERVFRQVSIPLGGGVRIRPDFMVVTVLDYKTRGEVVVKFIDAKGYETEAFRTKRKLLACRGIKIELARS
jgi:hypothetical protein